MTLPSVRSVSQNSADATGTSLSLSLPTGATAGDLLVAVLSSQSGTAPWNVLSGWSEEIAGTTTGTGGASDASVQTRVMQAGDTGPFVFTIQGGTNRAVQGGILAVQDAVAVNASAHSNDGNVADTTIPCPDLTTTADDCLVFRMFVDTSGTVTAQNGALDARLRLNVAASANVRRIYLCDEDQATAGAVGEEIADFSLSVGHQGITLAIEGAPSVPTETLVPVAGGSSTGLSTYDATKIDEDTGSDDGQWFVGTDPSGTSGSSNTNYADAQAAATGIAGQLSLPNNAVGSSEASTSSTAGTTQNNDYATFFTFDETALAAAIPSNATITGFVVRLRDSLSTLTRGDVGVRVDSANGTQIAAEDVAKTGLTTSLPAAGTGVHTATPATLPTRAQIVASTFGVRVRYRRTASQAATFTLDWLRLEVSYTVPGSTVNTEVRAPMSDPASGLATGAATGEIRALVRKLGTGSDPSGRLEVRNAAGTLLATAKTDTAVSSTSGVVLSGTFDQANISSPTDVVVWVVGTGAAGGLLEVGAINWVAQNTTTLVAGNTRQVLYDVRGLAGNTRQALYNVSGLAGASRALSYDIRALAGNQRTILYDLRAPAGNTRQIRYDVYGRAGNSRQVLFNVSGRAGNSRTILYDILAAALVAGNSRQVLYDVRAPVGNTRGVLYNVSGRAGNTRAVLFNVSGLAGNQRSILYDLRAPVGNTRVLRYDVYGRAGNTRVIVYNVSNLAGNQRQILYDLRGLSGNQRQILYNVSGRAGNTRVISYNVNNLAGNTRQIRFDLRGLAGNQRTVLYDVQSQILVAGNTRSIRYDVRALAGNTHQVLYNVSGLAGNTRPILYNVNSRAGNQRVIRYDLYALAGTLRQIRYDVFGLAGNARTILYNVERLTPAYELLLLEIEIMRAAELGVDVIAGASLEKIIEAPASLEAEAIAAASLAQDVIKTVELEPETWALR